MCDGWVDVWREDVGGEVEGAGVDGGVLFCC